MQGRLRFYCSDMESSLSSLPSSLSRTFPFPPPANPRSSPYLRFHLRRSFPWLPTSTRKCSGLRHVMCAGPPSPVPEDPLGKDSTSGLEAKLYRIRDGVQIFFSVLFWMSLFFWTSAWDGRDNTRPRKGSRFRR